MEATLDALKTDVERLELEQRKRELETAQSPATFDEDLARIVLQEAFGDYGLDRREFLHDDPTFGFGSPFSPIANINDREDGKFRPVFDNEVDLATIRGMGRVMSSYFPAGINIQENLTNYVAGTGFNYSVAAKHDDEATDEVRRLIRDVQYVVDQFLEDNDWVGDREREEIERSRTDGEVILDLHPDGWRTKLREIEPEQLVEPRSKRDLEDWLGVGDQMESSWSFGIHTNKRDVQSPLGYHIVRDSLGNDWDYLPANRVEHIKRNVPRNVKRGLSDFFPAWQFMQNAEKLLNNATVGASLQAAIAWVVEHAEGTSKGQAERFVKEHADRRSIEPSQLGPTTRYVSQSHPGRIINTRAGQQYKAGPMGSTNAPNFVLIIQAALRYVGIRWSMPEYMISGDASNANMASTLVAESPFVKAREADQIFYVSRFKRLLWKVVRIAWEHGFFDKYRLRLDEIQRLVEIMVEPPEVASRDMEALANSLSILVDRGIVSKETVANKFGFDFEEEKGRGLHIAPNVTPAMQGAIQGAFEEVESMADARNLLESLGLWRS